VVARPRRHVRDAAFARADRQVEAQLEVVEHADPRRERLHAPPPEEGARVEVAAVGEVPERLFHPAVYGSAFSGSFAMADEPRLLTQLDEAGVLLVTLNRPARKNAFDGPQWTRSPTP
jgi:hypothetical protein